MAEKNIQMQRKTATGYDKYYPKTKVELVAGAAKQADLDAHLAEKATDAQDGHVQVDGITITADANGIITAETPETVWNKIDEITVPSNTLEISVSVPTEYEEFRIIGKNLKHATTGDQDLLIQFNTSTTSYYTNVIDVPSGIVTESNTSGISVINVLAGGSDIGQCIIDIINFSTSQQTTMVNGVFSVATHPNQIKKLFGGWANTDKISSIQFKTTAGSLYIKTGSVFEIWGR